MMRTLLATAIALGVLGTGTAFASDSCTAPMADWQPKQALRQKLTAEGWKVRSIKSERGCYEAYAIDRDGHRREAYFDPKTLAMVDRKDED